MKDKKEKLKENVKKGKVEDAKITTDDRNKLGFLIIGLALLILISCGIYWAVKGQDTGKNEKANNSTEFKEEYESLNCKVGEDCDYLEVSISKDNPIVYSNYDEIFKLLEEGSGVIYFGFPECPWCRNLVPNMLEAAKDVGVDKIYYFNNKKDRDTLELKDGEVVTKEEGTKDYKKLLEKLDSVLSEYVLEDEDEKEVKTGEKRLYYPSIVVVKDGKIVDFHEGTLDSQKNPKIELTEEQKKELVETLSKKMEKSIVCDEHC